MKDIVNTIQIVIASVGGYIGYFLGGWDGFLYALVAFVVIDYLTGVMVAILEKRLSTAFTANYVRCLIISGAVPRMKCGKKYLVDVDLLIEHLRKVAQGNA